MRPLYPDLPLLLFCFLLKGIASGETANSSSLQSELKEANTLFQKANEIALSDPTAAREAYRKAARRFTHLSTAFDIQNSKLLANEGNAYFQAGDLGEAIFAYRRAFPLQIAL